jgi:general secretion pathway protein B
VSYILEALKKVEQKREQEEPSKVPTFLTGFVRESGQRVRWPYVLAAALLLNAGLVVWHVMPKGAPTVPPSAETPAGKAPAVAVRVPAKEIRKSTPSVAGHKERPALVAVATPTKPPTVSEAAPIPQSPVGKPRPVAPGRTASVNELSETIPSPPIRAEKPRPTAPPGRLFSLNELPPTIRSALPEFKVSGHAYTPEPQTRVVRINEKILQEGQDLSPGLKVEEIVQGGIILSYEGYRFRINIKEPN